MLVGEDETPPSWSVTMNVFDAPHKSGVVKKRFMLVGEDETPPSWSVTMNVFDAPHKSGVVKKRFMLVGEDETSPSWSVTMNLPCVGGEFETKNPCTSTEVIFEVQLFTLPTSDRSRLQTIIIH